MYPHAQTPIDNPIVIGRGIVPRKMSVRKNVIRRSNRGFTLVELLVVVAIMAILASIVLVSLSGVKGSRDLSKAAYDVQGVLEQARTYAMSTDTYTWVGFFEEDPNKPGVAGIGQVVISVVASASGTNPDPAPNPIASLPSSGLTQVAKLTKIPNTHLYAVPTSAVTRPSITATPASTYQVGAGSIGSWNFANTTTFNFPVSGTPQYTFQQIIQFSPQGDATRIADNLTPYMEIGLQPTHGDVIGTTGSNFAVIQVSGIGGQVITYRP